MESSQTRRDGGESWQKVVAVSLSALLLVIIIAAARYIRMRPIVSSSASMRSQQRQEEQQRDYKQAKSSILELLPAVKYSTRMSRAEHRGGQVNGYHPHVESKAQRVKWEFKLLSKNRKCKTTNTNSNTPIGLASILEENAPLEDPQSNDTAAACAICTEKFVENENVRILPCGHIYHRQCVDPWLLDFGTTCPLW